MRSSRSLALASALLVVAGCAGAELEGRASALEEVLETAREHGAYKCAPTELALAESHLAFAEQELSDGDYFRARQELAIADDNAHAAVEKSPKDRCNPEITITEEKKVELVVEIVDTDGDGIYDDKDGCPTEAEDKDGFEDEDGCPDPDNDADGILDADDGCPMVAEDKDGFEDADGCRDDDNDRDGLADGIDRCPDDAEDIDAFEDDDGCPDADNDGDKVVDYPDPLDKCPNEPAETEDGCPRKYTLIVVTSEKIELKQTIFFDYNKATIKPVSFPLLDEVAQALTDNAKIRVRIEGHTDSQGNDAYNKKLSQARAESVKAFLVKKGVESGRMSPIGYGEERPLADNRTQTGRDQNRRVEFFIVGDDAPTP